MAILRCNACGTLLEQPDSLAGQRLACPKCAKEAGVYPTLYFIERLLDKYFDAQRELIRLRSATSTPPAASPPAPAAESDKLPTPALGDFDLANTDQMATEGQHGPIFDWFQKRQIKVQANLRAVDTSGFFDEVAEAIGENLTLYKEVIERIRWSQQKDHASTTLKLEQRTPEDVAALTRFCQMLYDYSFVAKCFHNKPEKNIRLILQTAPGIRQFFNGEWLEWHALMASLRYAKERGRRFSCARGLNIELANGDHHEIDVFMLLDGTTPVCIECKTGEFRQNIDRYLALKKRLGLPGKQFIMCVAGLTDEEARAFTAMYDMGFVNERMLAAQLARLF